MAKPVKSMGSIATTMMTMIVMLSHLKTLQIVQWRSDTRVTLLKGALPLNAILKGMTLGVVYAMITRRAVSSEIAMMTLRK